MTNTELLPISHPESQAALQLQSLAASAQDYFKEARAANTKRAYQADWADFTAWCEAHTVTSLPARAETVVLYLTDRALTCKVSTLTRRVAAISKLHQLAGHESPTHAVAVRELMRGIRHRHGSASAQKAPLITAELRAVVESLPDSLLGARDRALLLLGFAGAFRRSEVVALDVADLTFATEGLVVTVRRSKTDQAGVGREVGIPYGSYHATCPVRAVRAWLDQARITEGAVFRAVNRHGQVQPLRLCANSVARIVKRCVVAADLDPEKYAGHSLRAGLATSAAAADVPERAIMEQTGHKSPQMVRRYIRKGSLWKENAAAKVGL